LITDYRYDSLYRISKVKTPNGKIIHYSYDGYGRQSKRITPDAGQTTYIYDNISNLTYTQDANQRNVNTGKYTFRNYDGLNRLTGIGERIFEIDSPSDGGQYQPNTATNYLTINVYDTITSAIVNIFTGVGGYSNYPNYPKGNLAAIAYRTRYTDSWNFKYYRYDVRGRVIKLWNIISGFDTLVTDYSYNSQDQITFVTYQPTKEDLKTYNYTYDYSGKLKDVNYVTGPPSDDPGEFTNLVSYEYNENSQISVQRFKSDVINNTYLYNNRNWISSETSGGDQFNYQNTYFKNGNVKTQELSGSYNDNFTNTSDLTFTYGYDMSNRLLTSTSNIHSGDGYYLNNTYDKDGNILNLVRYESVGNQTDKFSYTYVSGTNKLDRVEGIKQQFKYDLNGNMTKDSLNSNYNILYDYRNLIIQLSQRVKESSATTIDTTIYTTYYYYDESGNRIRKKIYKFVGSIIPAEEDTPLSEDSLSDLPSSWEMYNDEIYSKGIDGKDLCIYKNNEVEQWNIYGLDNVGKLQKDGNKLFLFYYLKDHLGSVRATVDDEGSLISSEDYDAWGYKLKDRSYQADEGKFKFTGKERDKENSYDYFGARYYDARIGRWGAVDPIVDQRISWSPYNYVLNNPLNRIDIDGFMDRPIYDTDGYFLGTDDNGLQGDAIVMNRNNFKQGMSIEEASSNNLGIEGLSGGDAESRFSEHFNKLKDRPDYDGYLTLDEANMWYQKGEGQSLFTALDKIDLSGIYSLGESFVGDERVFNLFLNSNSVNDALVYGSITLKRYPDNQIRAYADRYDFKMHNSLDPTNWPRNFATKVGETFAGEGNFFIINIYGSKKLESLFP